MNIQQLKDRFKERADLFPEIETFIFNNISAINIDRNKSYPVCLMKIPQGITTPFQTDDIEPLWENQTITFYIFKLYTKEIEKTVPLEQIYREIETIGDGYLRDVLQTATNEFSLIGDKPVTKERPDKFQLTVDPVMAVSWTFTLRVFNSLCNELVKPTNLVITMVSSSALDLTWTDNSTTESNYEVFRGIDSISFAKIATLPADTVAFSDTGLAADTVFYYKIKVVDLNGGGVFSDIVASKTDLSPPFGIAYQRPIFTSQTTIVVNFDDGFHFTNGTYDYTPPLNPASVARLDTSSASPFFTLTENNDFGNKNRFTDSLGGQVYDGTGSALLDYVIDHLTGLGWFRRTINANLSTFDVAVANAAAATTVGFSDWRLASAAEINSIVRLGVETAGNFIPMLLTGFIWTSTTRGGGATPTQGYSFLSQPYQLNANAQKTFLFGEMYVRNNFI